MRHAVTIHTWARSLASLACGIAAFAATADAQTRATVPGFNLSFTAPAELTRAGAEGRASAWQLAGSDVAIFVFAGAFHPLELAVGDAAQVLEQLPEQEPEVLTAYAEGTIGGRDGASVTVRARGQDGKRVVVRMAAVRVEGATTLTGIALVPDGQPGVRARAAAALDALLGSATATAPDDDASIRAQLVGTWRSQSGYSSGGSGGGFVDETTWQFAADGSFTRRRNFTASLSGAAVEPTRETQQGRWRAIGGALVLEGEGQTLTIGLELSGRQATIGNERFLKQ